MPDSRILKLNEENQRKQAALVAAMQKPPPAKEREKERDVGNSSNASRRSIGGSSKDRDFLDRKDGTRGTKRARETVEQVSSETLT